MCASNFLCSVNFLFIILMVIHSLIIHLWLWTNGMSTSRIYLFNWWHCQMSTSFPLPLSILFFLNTSRSEFKTLDKKSTSYMVTHTIRNLTDQEMSPVSLQVQTQVPDNSILPVNSNGKNIVLKSHNTWFKYHLLPNQTTWFEQAVRVGDLWGPQR